LRVLAGADRCGVGKDMAATHRLDRAELAAGIARKACVRRWVDIPGPHGLTCLEPRRSGRRTFEGRYPTLIYVVEGQLAVQPNAGTQHSTDGELVFANETMRDCQAL
jgi:hypothetical protein